MSSGDKMKILVYVLQVLDGFSLLMLCKNDTNNNKVLNK